MIILQQTDNQFKAIIQLALVITPYKLLSSLGKFTDGKKAIVTNCSVEKNIFTVNILLIMYRRRPHLMSIRIK